MHLDKIRRMSIVIDTPSVEPSPSSFHSQPRDDGKSADYRSSVRWRGWQWHIKNANEALYNENLDLLSASVQLVQPRSAHDELARIELGYFIVVKPFSKIEKRARNILIPYKSFVIVS